MQICLNLLRLIFLLSTIVIVTDCCSSRILLLREHTLKIVHQTQNFHSHHIHEHAQLEDTPKTLAKEILEQLQRYLAEISTMPSDLEPESTTPPPDASFDDTGQSADGSTTPLVDLASTDAKSENVQPDTKATVTDSEYVYRGFPCTGELATSYCLNGGRCFFYMVANYTMLRCECADNYGSVRCDTKNANGDYAGPAASELKKLSNLRAARIVFSFPMLLTLSIFYLFVGALYVFRCSNHQQKYRAAGMLAS